MSLLRNDRRVDCALFANVANVANVGFVGLALASCIGLMCVTGCQLPSTPDTGAPHGSEVPQASLPSQPTTMRSGQGFSQRYPAVSSATRFGGAPTRGLDGAPAFGAGPGGSGIIPR